MNPTANARRLRRHQTTEEKELWRAVRAGRFAGFKFRRQHPIRGHYLDFYCPIARLAVELDGSQHGLPQNLARDETREKVLLEAGIEVLRFWNHRWNGNREGVLTDIWQALHQRTGCVQVMRKVNNNRFVPPNSEKIIKQPATPRRSTSQGT